MGGGFLSDNYIPNLTVLSEENDNFSGTNNTLNGGIILPGTQWTTAALFCQSSGLPLQLPIGEDSTDNSEAFFPNLITLGDILKENGYSNYLALGSPASFGAQKAFVEQHGEYTIHDYDYAISNDLIPEGYYVNWGFEDEKLFDNAKKDLLEISKKDTPFNYTMFTIDTHFEDGYVCRLCNDEFGDNQYANVIACSDRQVSAFIDWIKEQDFYDKTTIVITGDHTTMDTDFCENISKDYQRRTYTCIINSAVKPQNNTYRDYSTMDLFPTTLAALGIELSSDRLGCGTNLYSNSKTIIEEYSKEKCSEEFGKGSPFVMTLANISVTEADMTEAQNAAYLEAADENGFIRFRLYYADTISYVNIKDLTLKIIDKSTGTENSYNIEFVRTRTGWHGVVHTDIPIEDITKLECEVYISVDDYKNYLFKSFEPDDFHMWDIRWDVD